MRLNFPINNLKSKKVLIFAGIPLSLLVLGLTVIYQQQQTSVRSKAAEPAVQSLEGEYIIMHQDNIETEQSLDQAMLQLQDGKRVLLKYNDNKIDPDIEPGSRIRVTGKRYSDSLLEIAPRTQNSVQILQSPAVKQIPFRQENENNNVRGIAAKTLRVAVVLVNFPDLKEEPYSREDIVNAVFAADNSVNKWVNENSYGKVSLGGIKNAGGDVFGYYTMSNSKNSYSGGCASGVDSEAMQRVRNEGVDPSKYDFIIVTYPRPGDCYWGGISFGGKVLITLKPEKAKPDTWRRYAIHESAHEFGARAHGKGLICSVSGVNVAIAPTCSSTEGYKDPYDFVGGGRHYNGAHKEQVGFIDSSQIQTITSSGTYQVEPIAKPSSGNKVLRIKAANSKLSSSYSFSADNNTPYFYIDYRRNFGFDDVPNANFINGVFIRRTGVKSNGVADTRQDTLLVDNNPDAKENFSDAVLAVGKTFYDSANKITIETVSVNDSYATVKVDLNAINAVTPTPSNSSPTPTKALTPTPTKSSSPTPTKSSSPTPTKALTPTPTRVATPTPTRVATPTPTFTPNSSDRTPPTAPSQLAGFAAGNKINYLVWTGSKDNVGVVGYHIVRDNVRIGTIRTNYPRAYYVDTNVVSGRRYVYKVQAFDAAGNLSAFSNSISVLSR